MIDSLFSHSHNMAAEAPDILSTEEAASEGREQQSLLSKETSDPLELVGQSWELCPD